MEQRGGRGLSISVLDFCDPFQESIFLNCCNRDRPVQSQNPRPVPRRRGPRETNFPCPSRRYGDSPDNRTEEEQRGEQRKKDSSILRRHFAPPFGPRSFLPVPLPRRGKRKSTISLRSRSPHGFFPLLSPRRLVFYLPPRIALVFFRFLLH